jgi:hypothetical protein
MNDKSPNSISGAHLSSSAASAHPAGPHLTDTQLDDLLLDDAAPELQGHLDACPACNARLAQFRGTLALFNEASLSWSAAKSNTLSRDLSTHRASFRLPSWSLAAVMLFVVALALAFTYSRPDGSRSVALNHTAVSRDGQQADQTTRDQEIASDNVMLQAIHSEIYRPEPSPLAPYEQAEVGQGTDLTVDSHPVAPHRPSTPQVRD